MSADEIYCMFPLQVPDVDFSYPPCPVCDDGTELSYDSGWYCQTCNHAWDESGQRGEHVS